MEQKNQKTNKGIRNFKKLNIMENQIEEILFNRFQTSFTVSKDKYGYIVTANDTIKIAGILEVEIDSEEFWHDMDKIEKAINLLFL